MDINLNKPEGGFITVGEMQVAYSVVRSRRRRRTIAFQMENDNRLRVMAPTSASLRSLHKMAQEHAHWVAQKLSERQAAPPLCDFSDGAALPYLGHVCRLQVQTGAGAAALCQLSPRLWRIQVPDDALSSQGLRDEARLEVQLWLKKRARILLKKRLDIWARKLGVDYRRFMLADPDHRWGSCSVDNVIRLNWRLILVPLAVVDYVAAHELCHVRHKNHSPRFWGALEQIMPDWRDRRKQLRRYESNLAF